LGYWLSVSRKEYRIIAQLVVICGVGVELDFRATNYEATLMMGLCSICGCKLCSRVAQAGRLIRQKLQGIVMGLQVQEILGVVLDSLLAPRFGSFGWRMCSVSLCPGPFVLVCYRSSRRGRPAR